MVCPFRTVLDLNTADWSGCLGYNTPPPLFQRCSSDMEQLTSMIRVRMYRINIRWQLTTNMRNVQTTLSGHAIGNVTFAPSHCCNYINHCWSANFYEYQRNCNYQKSSPAPLRRLHVWHATNLESCHLKDRSQFGRPFSNPLCNF